MMCIVQCFRTSTANLQSQSYIITDEGLKWFNSCSNERRTVLCLLQQEEYYHCCHTHPYCIPTISLMAASKTYEVFLVAFCK